MITCILVCLLLPERMGWVCIPFGVIEVLFVVFGMIWRSDTSDMPKLHYRTFRRIERMAPEKWEPASYYSTGIVQYNENGWNGTHTRIAMKTYPEALLCKFLYEKQYQKRKRDQEINQIMENCVALWKSDIDAYRAKAEAQAKKAMEESVRLSRGELLTYRDRMKIPVSCYDKRYISEMRMVSKKDDR